MVDEHSFAIVTYIRGLNAGALRVPDFAPAAHWPDWLQYVA
jgi:hypothetical protein